MVKKPTRDNRLAAPRESARKRPGPGGTDWSRVRADHNTGQFTDHELAQLHGLHPGSIKRRRLQDNATDPSLWLIDRSGEVQRATQALLLHQEIAEVGASASAVLQAALVARDVILGHRQDVKRARDVAMALLDELATTTTSPAQLAQLFEVCSAGLDPEQLAALREQFKGFMKLHARASSMHKLADSLAKVQGLERRAFGIADGDDPGRDEARHLSDLERAARLTRILDRARAQREQAQQAAQAGADGAPPAPASSGQAQPPAPPMVH